MERITWQVRYSQQTVSECSPFMLNFRKLNCLPHCAESKDCKMFVKVLLFYRKAKKIESHLKTFFDIAQEMELPSNRNIEEESGIVFDPRHYLASTTVRIIRCLSWLK